MADRITELYRAVTRDLSVMLAGARAGASEGFVRAQLAALARQVQRLGPEEAAWIQENVPAEYRAAASQAHLTLRQADVTLAVTRFTGVDQRAVRALATRISTDLADIRNAIGRGLVLQDPRLGVRAVRDVLSNSNRYVEYRGGIPRVRTPSGQMWRVDAYASMLSRTAIADSRRVGFRQRYVQNGQDRVRVVEAGTVHDICLVWEGEILSLTGATNGLPTVDDAMAAGLFHPNCRHRYVIDTGPADAPTDEELLAAAPLDEPFPTLGRRPAASRRPAEPRMGI